MGQEVSIYMDRIVGLMQTAYGDAWNIQTRQESPVRDDRAWQVMVGVSRPLIESDGALGLNLTLECAATVRYVSKATTHASGFQAIDIANSLAAWLANNVDVMTIALPHDIEVAYEPVLFRADGQTMNSGRYLAHVFWQVELDRIDPDIDIAGYTTGHPSRHRVSPTYYYEIEQPNGTKQVVQGGEDPPRRPVGGFVRRIFLAEPDSIPSTTDTEVYYPILSPTLNPTRVDSGAVAWTFAIPTPTIAHGKSAGAANWTFAIPQPTVMLN